MNLQELKQRLLAIRVMLEKLNTLFIPDVPLDVSDFPQMLREHSKFVSPVVLEFVRRFPRHHKNAAELIQLNRDLSFHSGWCCVNKKLVLHASNRNHFASFIPSIDEAISLIDPEYRRTPSMRNVWQPLSVTDVPPWGLDLTELAHSGKLRRATGRETEMRQLIHILTEPDKNNPILIGHAGVGKTALLDELAIRIVEGSVPPHLLHCRIFQADLTAMMAGTNFRGDFEKRLDTLLHFIIASDGRILLAIDEVHRVINAGAAQNTDGAGQALKSSMARGQLRLIGATTMEEYEIIKRDGALERRCSPVLVRQPDSEQTLHMLQGAVKHLEGTTGLILTNEALQEAVRLSDRKMPQRYQPDKAFEVITRTITRLSLAKSAEPATLTDMRERLRILRQEHFILARESAPASREEAQRKARVIERLQAQITQATTNWHEAKQLQQDESCLPESAQRLQEQYPDLFVREVTAQHVQQTFSPQPVHEPQNVIPLTFNQECPA